MGRSTFSKKFETNNLKTRNTEEPICYRHARVFERMGTTMGKEYGIFNTSMYSNGILERIYVRLCTNGHQFNN